MQPGVAAVQTFAWLTPVVVGLLVVGVFALLLLIGAFMRSSWRQGVVSGVVLVAVVVAGGVVLPPRLDAWREHYDYDATWARVEARYGVRLSAEDTERTLPWPRGRHSGGIVDQDHLGPVVMPDGSVREDLYLQVQTGRPARVAVVTKPEGANELLVTVGGWWDELPVVDDAVA
ncbi:hypothetical protein [Cellulomonas sp. NPDC058312]|uniref:hypothetical protein n=1 Tax=Cellulomonas sp. NPDC058312 TaxID=3346441 RepID=UPI0036EE0C6A